MSDELREHIAAVQHEIWSHWMRYLFSRAEGSDYAGGAVIPNALVLRWQRQMETPYAGLTERERESDREQADKVLAVMAAELAAATQRAEAAEAQLAAVPQCALWRLYNDFPYANISESFGADFATAFEEIFEWLKTQPEVQP